MVAQLDAHLEEPLLDCLARDAHGDPCLQAASPLDVEASLAMPGGHIFHGDLSWPVARSPEEVGGWGVATDHPRIVAASSGAPCAAVPSAGSAATPRPATCWTRAEAWPSGLPRRRPAGGRPLPAAVAGAAGLSGRRGGCAR